MCPEDLCFVSLQRHDFLASKELEVPLAGRKPEYRADTCAESTPFRKNCCPCVLKALVCITLQMHMMGYSVCYHLSLDVMIDIDRSLSLLMTCHRVYMYFWWSILLVSGHCSMRNEMHQLH